MFVNGAPSGFIRAVRQRKSTNSIPSMAAGAVKPAIDWSWVDWLRRELPPWINLSSSSIEEWDWVGYGPEAPLPRTIPFQQFLNCFHFSCLLILLKNEREDERAGMSWLMKVEWKVGWWNGEWGGKHITFYPVIKRKLVFFYGGSHSQLISSTHFIPQNKKINLLFLLHSIQLIY